MRIFKLNKLVATKLAVIGCVLLFIWYFTTRVSQSSSSIRLNKAPQRANNKSTKKILMWNKFFKYNHFGYDLRYPVFKDLHCEVTNCQIWDVQDGMPDIPVEDFDLVWFHGLPADTLWPSRPRVRKPNQVYLFFLFETPTSYQESDYRQLRGFFNWTATYRVDSDIFAPYAWFSNKTKTPVMCIKPDLTPTFIHPRFNNITTQVATKTKLIYGLVSHCNAPSDRDAYTEELSRHTSVDIYGKCGTPCTTDTCDFGNLAKSYRFYLAFENTLCKDYISGRFFDTMQYDVVPVVFGGADYARHAPPHSYIDTRDFESPHQLATYLYFLAGNDAEYRKYFWWKDYYVPCIIRFPVLCQMCAMLNDPPPPKVVEDLEGWWNAGGDCRKKPARFLPPRKNCIVT